MYGVCKICKKEYIIKERRNKCPYCHEEGFLMNVGFNRCYDENLLFKAYILGYRDGVGCIAEFDDEAIARDYCINSDGRVYIQINRIKKEIVRAKNEDLMRRICGLVRQSWCDSNSCKECPVLLLKERSE